MGKNIPVSGLHISGGEQRIAPELPHLQSKNFPEVKNVMIPHQPKVKQRLAMRGCGTFCKVVLLKIFVISVAYSSLKQTTISVNFHFSGP